MKSFTSKEAMMAAYNQANHNFSPIEGEKNLTKDPNTVQIKDWKYLYKETYDKILFPTAINNHFEYFKMFVEWGSEINVKDFQGWTPLHWAAYSGNIDIVKFLWDNPVTEIEVEDDERRTPLLVSIESGNVLGNENTSSVLLENGTLWDNDIWDKLLLLSADQDLIVYPRIAFKQGILKLKYRGDDRFSIHKVVKWEAIHVLHFIIEHFDPK